MHLKSCKIKDSKNVWLKTKLHASFLSKIIQKYSVAYIELTEIFCIFHGQSMYIKKFKVLLIIVCNKIKKRLYK